MTSDALNMNALIKSSKKRYWEILTLMGRPAVRRWAPLVIALVGVGVARGRCGWFRLLGRHYDVLGNFLKLRPLNNVIRYYTALDVIDKWTSLVSPHPKLLELAPAPGAGHMVPYPFWGCDTQLGDYINPI